MSFNKSKILVCISIFSLFLSFSSSLYAEKGYTCILKEAVLCAAVVPTCIKLPDGDFTTYPLISEDCFDKTVCYKQEAEDFKDSLALQSRQISKLQEENRKLKTKFRLLRKAK